MYDSECRQTAEKSKVVQCQWKTLHVAPLNTMINLTVFDLSGRAKERTLVTGLSGAFTGRQLKYNAKYKLQIGAASTEIILSGKLSV